jgi:hypothetical protein
MIFQDGWNSLETRLNDPVNHRSILKRRTYGTPFLIRMKFYQTFMPLAFRKTGLIYFG